MRKEMDIIIQDIEVVDLRFPTSKTMEGSDATNLDPDYSAVYLTLKTNIEHINGYGLTFTIGRGNEICISAVNALFRLIKGYNLKDITRNMSHFAKHMNSDSQLRWLGPEKGVIHISSAAIINAVWDLWSRVEKKPLWKLISDMSPRELVNCIDFTRIEDVVNPKQALEMLKKLESTKSYRIKHLSYNGYPAYSTSAGWLGYSDETLSDMCNILMKQGWNSIKLKVGNDLKEDIRRLTIARKIVGSNCRLMIDANQKWEIKEAVDYLAYLSKFNLWWIEEPISPDDILGHSSVRKKVAPMKVATGEHCHNKVMFKQLMQANAIDFCQIDSCRLAGVNEVLAVMLMASRFDIPICPHAGGIGLCEYVQHLSMIDFICISGNQQDRVIEYVDALSDHFINPVKVKNGRYLLPLSVGYTVEIKSSSIKEYSFPLGAMWR
jgi:L-fuconate dehydratase